MIKESLETGKGGRYSVIRLTEDHIEDLKTLLKNRLVEICYGQGAIEMEPDEYTYHKACKHIWRQLMKSDFERRYAIIGEMIMHLLSPLMIHFNVEPISLMLSLQDRNIKHGFDINFYSPEYKKIWYGEVKSGYNQKRVDLINRAHKDLDDYFQNIESPGKGKNNTSYRWEAAKNEARVILSADHAKLKQILASLTESREGILKRQGAKRNALIMTVNFGAVNSPTQHKDIEQYLDGDKAKRSFDNCIVLSVAKENIDDIITFLQQEGNK